MNDTDNKDDKESDNSLGVAIPIASPKIDNELDVIVAPPPAKDTKLVNGFVIAFHQDHSNTTYIACRLCWRLKRSSATWTASLAGAPGPASPTECSSMWK